MFIPCYFVSINRNNNSFNMTIFMFMFLLYTNNCPVGKLRERNNSKVKKGRETKMNETTTKSIGEAKYYLVTAKCGHVGRNFYIPVTFAVKATSGKEAAANVRQFPRVKHDHKDAIIEVFEVSSEQYERQLLANNWDPYLHIDNRRDHRALEFLFADRLMPEQTSQNPRREKHSVGRNACKAHYSGKKRIRNPKKWACNYAA